MNVKIAIIGSRGYPYVYSGYETFVKEVSERLVSKGVSVTVYCHKQLFSSYPRSVNGIQLKYFSTIELKSISQVIHSFQCMLHAVFSDVDIILVVNSANGPFGLISKIFRKPTAINVDGLEWLRPKWKGLGARYFYWASNVATKLYDEIINDSDAMAEIYKREFNADSTVIAYGANIRFSQQPSLLDKWHLEKNDYYLIVGRLIPDNNADLIVEEFIKSISRKKLVIVGDVHYKDKYADRIKKTNDARILFTGYVENQDELAELYHNSFIYFHGHEYGGTNPTMLKALAYGCAIIALDTVFTREMLENGKYGIFFEKTRNNLAELIDKIENTPDELSKFREISRERILDNYTWSKVTNQYARLFEKMMS
jgi:glycosyltransferase involved in cell wall biosynthesis